MRFPDVRQLVAVQRLFRQLGIEELPRLPLLVFERTHVEGGPIQTRPILDNSERSVLEEGRSPYAEGNPDLSGLGARAAPPEKRKRTHPCAIVLVRRWIGPVERHERRRSDPKQRREYELLQSASVDTTAADLSADKQELLTLNGRHVLVYIPAQLSQGIDMSVRTSTYKFHLANCRTLVQMASAGRSHRYRATRRTDGSAPVALRDGRAGEQVIVKMGLCQNCVQHLQGVGRYPIPFSYKRYFAAFGNEAPREIPEVEERIVTKTYAPDHAELSRAYRKQAGWRCQRCLVDCSQHRRLLHLHHVDADPSNNSHANLRVLCVACHSEAPYHSHMSGPSRDDIVRVRALLNEQLEPIGI